MLTNRADVSNIITNLCSWYPSQIPITITSEHNTTHYLDLTLSLNHFTIMNHNVQYQVYQKPHHKYAYPHFSSNHPQHIFTGIIKTETIRYCRLSATPDDYNFIHKLCSLRLIALNYPDKLISEHSFPWLMPTDGVLKIQGRIQGGWIGWISTPHFSVKQKIRNVTLFEIENKERKKN